ncbi:DUF1667 domain-containing protein [Cellulosilyticum sp. I15G10I2]|uniref:DUF1667 domain-containing protein n=1 Tax=Cellulosilyticum sp. I15G10I2 TaxID=1892843 RepID=UPI00085CC9A4|nr:DUF1667 domain-containing protein [Cellulosilyticum sp. I15G10I2]
MLKKITCIVCPIGCTLEVNTENKAVTGHGCKRGEVYGVEEVTNPTRVITTTVKLNNSIYSMIPVKTSGGIPKNLNFRCIEVLNTIEVDAPVKVGDVIVKNLLDTGIDVIATRTILAK